MYNSIEFLNNNYIIDYNFINTHQKYLKKNYSWARHVAFWNKKPENEKKDIIKNAKAFMKKLCITK